MLCTDYAYDGVLMNIPRAPLLWPRSRYALCGVLAAVGNALLRVAIVPLLVVPMVDDVLQQLRLETLPSLLGWAALVVLAGALMLFAQDACLGAAAATIAAQWRAALLRCLLLRQPGQLPGTSGGLSSRILGDLKDLELFYQYGLGTLVAESFTALGIMAVLLWSNAQVTLWLLVVVLPLLLVLRRLGGWLERLTVRSQAQAEQLGSALQENLKQHVLVRSFRLDSYMQQRFARSNAATAAAMRRRHVLSSLQIPSSQVLIFMAMGLLLTLLASSIAAATMSLGDVIAYLTLVLLLATPAQLLPRGYALLQQARAARQRLLELAELPVLEKPATAEPQESGEYPQAGYARSYLACHLYSGQSWRSSRALTLELEQLSFAYPGAAPLFTGLQAQWQAPALLAITGASGMGKSTLLQLLLRFLEPTSGSIYLGGSLLETIPEALLREKVLYAGQEPALLRSSIRDNVCLARVIPEAALWQALEAVQLASVIKQLPGGLDYRLGEDGSGLSGGQRQRLCLARAILHNPALLLLDEPTANLDAHSEALVLEVLRQQARQRLIIVVAHSPAVLRAADAVYQLSLHGLHPVSWSVGRA